MLGTPDALEVEDAEVWVEDLETVGTADDGPGGAAIDDVDDGATLAEGAEEGGEDEAVPEGTVAIYCAHPRRVQSLGSVVSGDEQGSKI